MVLYMWAGGKSWTSLLSYCQSLDLPEPWFLKQYTSEMAPQFWCHIRGKYKSLTIKDAEKSWKEAVF